MTNNNAATPVVTSPKCVQICTHYSNNYYSGGTTTLILAWKKGTEKPVIKPVKFVKRPDGSGTYEELFVEVEGEGTIFGFGSQSGAIPSPRTTASFIFGEEKDSEVVLPAAWACKAAREKRLPEAVRFLESRVNKRLAHGLGTAVFRAMNPEERTRILLVIAGVLRLSPKVVEGKKPRKAAYDLARAAGWRPTDQGPNLIGDFAVAEGWEVEFVALDELIEKAKNAPQN